MTQLNVNNYFINIFILLPKLIVLLSFNSSVHIKKRLGKEQNFQLKVMCFTTKFPSFSLWTCFCCLINKNIGAMSPHLSPEVFAPNLEFVSLQTHFHHLSTFMYYMITNTIKLI